MSAGVTCSALDPSEYIDGRVQLRAAGAFVAIPRGASPALELQARDAAVEHDGRGPVSPTQDQAQHGPQIVDHALKAANPQPALRLIVCTMRGRQVRRHSAASHTIANDVPQPVEHLPQAVIAIVSCV